MKKKKEKERARRIKKTVKDILNVREIKGKYKKPVASSAAMSMLLTPLRYLKPHAADGKWHHPGKVNLGNSFENAPHSFSFCANGTQNKV